MPAHRRPARLSLTARMAILWAALMAGAVALIFSGYDGPDQDCDLVAGTTVYCG